MQPEEMHHKILVKVRRLMRFLDKVKECKENRSFRNEERKSYKQISGEYQRKIQQPDEKETKQFVSKIWKQKYYNGNGEWMNRIKDLEKLEGGSEANLLLDSLKETLVKIPNWKTPRHPRILILKIIVHHNILILLLSKYLQEVNLREWETKGKTSLI